MHDSSQGQTFVWAGHSGEQYKYWVYPIGSTLKAEPGNYIFAKLDRQGRWEPIYVGETENLNERFDNHHAAPCVKRNGATHIHAHLTSGGRQRRLDEETDVRRRFDPPCNRQ